MNNHRTRPLNDAAGRCSPALEAVPDGDATTRLENKVTLIFGDASEGVESLAVALSRKGSNVIILTSRDKSALEDDLRAQVKAYGRTCLIIQETVVNERVAQEIVEEILDRFGRLDVYIDYSGRPFFIDSPSSGGKNEPPGRPGLAMMKAAFPLLDRSGQARGMERIVASFKPAACE